MSVNKELIVTGLSPELENSENNTLEEFELSYYWNLARRHLVKIVVLSILITTLAVLVSLSLTPVYRATATLLIENKDAEVLSIEEVYGLTGREDGYRSTQYEILKSREIARYVVRAESLVDIAEFNPFHPKNKSKDSLFSFLNEKEIEKPSEEVIFESTVTNFQRSLSISPIRGTQLVDVSVDSLSPELAAKLADSVCRQYVNIKLLEKSRITDEAAHFLKERLGGLKAQLEESEKKLQAYRDTHGLVDLSGVDTLVSKEIDQITTQLIQARSKRLELESMYTYLNSLDSPNMESLASLPAIVSHPLVGSLRQKEAEAELKVSELSKRYGHLHPKMIAAQSELVSVRESLFVQMKRISKSFINSYITSKDKEESLSKALEYAKRQAGSINVSQFELNSLVREVQSNRQLYDMFFSRINETNATGDLDLPTARIIDPAVLPDNPFKPRKKVIVALALVGSILFGLTVVFIIDLLDSTIKNPDEVDRKLGVYMLGLLPIMGGRKNRRKGANAKTLVRAFSENTEHGFTESVRTIRTSLTLATMDNPAKIILVSSSVPFEGKTTLSCNLAEAMGQVEKTLLIDADMRRPSVAKKLELLPFAPGLSNAVAHPENLDESIQHINDLGIDVMSSGPIPPNPLELLNSRHFQDILDTLRERYDRIIIDTAPVHAVSDAVYLSTLVDGVVYVVKADSTKDTLVKKGLDRLRINKANILGVVLNQVDVERERKYTSSYSGYYDSYDYTYDNPNLNER